METRARRPSTVAQYLAIKRDPVTNIRECYETAKRETESLRGRRVAIRQAYHGYIKEAAKRKGRANFHHHVIFPIIETAVARFVVSYFRHDPFVTVIPDDEQSVQAAQNHEDALQHYYEHCPVHFLETLRFYKYTLMDGEAYRLPTWRRVVGKIRKQVPIIESGIEVGQAYVETTDVIYEGLWFDTYPSYQCFPYPFVKSFAKLPWFCLEEFIHIDELLKLAKNGTGGFHWEKVNNIPLNCSGQNEASYRLSQTALGRPVPENDSEMIRLVHKFTGDSFQTLANDKVLCRDIDNDLFPGQTGMVQGIMTLDPDSVHPIGLAAPLMPNQKLSSSVISRMVDYLNQSTYWVWKHTGDVDPRYLMSTPNNAIKVKQMSDVDIIQPPEMKYDIQRFHSLIAGSTEEITGYYGVQKGGGGSSGDPKFATLGTLYNDQGGQRIQSDVMTLEETSLVPEAKLVSSLVSRFAPEQITIRSAGPDGGPSFRQMGSDQIRGQFQFRIGGVSESMNRAVQQQQLINFLQNSKDATQFVQLPNGAIIPVPLLDMYNTVKMVLEPIAGKATSKLLYRPELFGIPLSNDLLSQYGLPNVPGLDNMPMNPATGGRIGGRAMLPPPSPASGPGTLPRGVNPTRLINNANRVAPTPMRSL